MARSARRDRACGFDMVGEALADPTVEIEHPAAGSPFAEAPVSLSWTREGDRADVGHLRRRRGRGAGGLAGPGGPPALRAARLPRVALRTGPPGADPPAGGGAGAGWRGVARAGGARRRAGRALRLGGAGCGRGGGPHPGGGGRDCLPRADGGAPPRAARHPPDRRSLGDRRAHRPHHGGGLPAPGPGRGRGGRAPGALLPLRGVRGPGGGPGGAEPGRHRQPHLDPGRRRARRRGGVRRGARQRADRRGGADPVAGRRDPGSRRRPGAARAGGRRAPDASPRRRVPAPAPDASATGAPRRRRWPPSGRRRGGHRTTWWRR
jgi:hypothetical protein